jgi:starch synthase
MKSDQVKATAPRPSGGRRVKAGGSRRVAAAAVAIERIPAVHLTAEYWPFARTGGLGEAVNGLAEAQHAAGSPATVVMPLYRTVREAGPALERVGHQFSVSVGAHTEWAHVYRLVDRPTGPAVFFIEHPGFFDRPGIYGDSGGDYPDNALRFAFFCKAAVAALPAIAPGAQVLHAHDWHTALAPVYLRTVFRGLPFHDGLAIVLSVHNAGFQGHYPRETMSELGLPEELYNPQAFEWYDRLNILKGGIAFSDIVVTVSPTHARELCTATGGFGLQDTFIALGDRLQGVLNGIDQHLWNPHTDPHIAANYSAEDLKGKQRCKDALQRAYDLPADERIPLFAMSARLVEQKGLDLVLGGSLFTSVNAQFVFLGSGERRYHEALADLAAAQPERIVAEFAFTDRQEHILLAGADLLLMPSLYEPCGLTQMRAQRYGAIPIVRAVGGLQDSVQEGVTGFLFADYTPAALEEAVHRVLQRYADRDEWRLLVQRAMGSRFGWDQSTLQYSALYRRALTAHAQA